LLDEGTPYLLLDGINDNVAFGSDAAIDDLFLADCTVESWFYSSLSDIDFLLSKFTTAPLGWNIKENVGYLRVRIAHDVTEINYNAAIPYTVDVWQHVAITWDIASKTVTTWIDGQDAGSATAAGNYVSDAAHSLNTAYGGTLNRWTGGLGWVRISDNQRYSAPFTPPPRNAPPAIDANTIEQWNVDEGSGSVLVGEVVPITATITGATWMED